MTWGAWLREQTEPLGLGVVDLAELLGVKQSSLSHYLNEGQHPSLPNLLSIADALHASIDRDIAPHLREDLARKPGPTHDPARAERIAAAQKALLARLPGRRGTT